MRTKTSPRTKLSTRRHACRGAVLVQRGADAGVADERGWTALSVVATLLGHRELIELSGGLEQKTSGVR